MEREKLEEIKAELNNKPTAKVFTITEKCITFLDNVTLLKGNRDIKQDKVKDLMESFINKVFIPAIYVAVPSFQIVEGNHRIVAFKKLVAAGISDIKLEVILTENYNPLETCLLINNTQTSWKSTEIFNAYCTIGNKEIIKLRSWMLTHSNLFVKSKTFNIGAAIQLLTGKKIQSKNYKNFVFPNELEMATIEVICNELDQICEALESTLPAGRGKILAWKEIRSAEPNFNKFIKRLKAYKGLFPNDGKDNWKRFYLQFMNLK